MTLSDNKFFHFVEVPFLGEFEDDLPLVDRCTLVNHGREHLKEHPKKEIN